MIIINKPDEAIDVQCYRCGLIMRVSLMANMNSEYFTDCNIHRKSVEELTDRTVNDNK
jgi:hypothetical protein